jgi:hypothetical protein
MTKLTAAQKKALIEVAYYNETYGHGRGRDNFHHATVRVLLDNELVTIKGTSGLYITDAGRYALQRADQPKPVSRAAQHPRFLALPAEE